MKRSGHPCRSVGSGLRSSAAGGTMGQMVGRREGPPVQCAPDHHGMQQPACCAAACWAAKAGAPGTHQRTRSSCRHPGWPTAAPPTVLRRTRPRRTCRPRRPESCTPASQGARWEGRQASPVTYAAAACDLPEPQPAPTTRLCIAAPAAHQGRRTCGMPASLVKGHSHHTHLPQPRPPPQPHLNPNPTATAGMPAPMV